MSLKTRVCDVLRIEHPIVLAGMGGASGPRLVAAVSEAGGLGILGAADCSAGELREQIAEVRRLTGKPFGVNTLLPASVRRDAERRADAASTSPSPRELLPQYHEFAAAFMATENLTAPTPDDHARLTSLGRPSHSGPTSFTQEFFDAQMEVVIEEQVPVYAAGLGSPRRWMDRLRTNGTRVMGVVGTVRQARAAADDGLDIIVAQGSDAGGHNSPVGTMALVPQVVDAAHGIPVLAAGGIADGRGVAAALMLGAEGAWIGTAFLATPEAGILEFQKQALLESDDESTTVTRSWTGKWARVLKGKWVRAFDDSGLAPLPMPYQQMVTWPILAAASVAGRKDVAPGVAGQGVGLIREILPAADVLRTLVRDTERALEGAARVVGPRP